MPVKKLAKNPTPPAFLRLKDRLVQEWRTPNSTAVQPVILEEGGSANQPLHLYVVWDDWNQLSQLERSEIIMDAFEEVHGTTPSLNVTVAMGLTPAEADRLGIKF